MGNYNIDVTLLSDNIYCVQNNKVYVPKTISKTLILVIRLVDFKTNLDAFRKRDQLMHAISFTKLLLFVELFSINCNSCRETSQIPRSSRESTN